MVSSSPHIKYYPNEKTITLINFNYLNCNSYGSRYPIAQTEY